MEQIKGDRLGGSETPRIPVPRRLRGMRKFPKVMELFRLDGQIGFVTGGARNLGYDMALALAEAGADVCITSRWRSTTRLRRERRASPTGGLPGHTSARAGDASTSPA